MNYNVIPVDRFKKAAKVLIRKYPSLKKELADLNTSLISNPTQGTPLGNSTFKIRIAIKSIGTSKSGGARIILRSRC